MTATTHKGLMVATMLGAAMAGINPADALATPGRKVNLSQPIAKGKRSKKPGIRKLRDKAKVAKKSRAKNRGR